MAANAILAPLAPQMKQTAIVENLGTGINQIKDLVAHFVDPKSGKGHPEKITQAVHMAFEGLQGLNESPELKNILNELANCPVGREISEQLAKELPTILSSLNVALLKRQYVVTDKSMAELGVLQARRVKEAWEEIKNSQKLCKTATATINSIDSQLKEMEDKYCVKIKKFIAATKSPQFNLAQKANIVCKVKTLYIRLRSKYNRVTSEINDLKLNIDGQIIRLRHQNKLQTDLVVQNFIVGAAGFAKNAMFDNLSAAADVAGGAASNILESLSTKLAIKGEMSKLEKIFAQVEALEVRLAEVANVKALAEKFLADNGVDPSTL